jgi:hypothetical protein
MSDIKDVPGTRYFSGRMYWLENTYPFKEWAKTTAKLLKAEGLSTRVVSTGSRGIGYAVYYLKKV